MRTASRATWRSMPTAAFSTPWIRPTSGWRRSTFASTRDAGHRARRAAAVRAGALAGPPQAYVTNLGMFQYQALPGADRQTGREHRPAVSGLRISESRKRAAGAERQTGRGTVKVPGLGDPNVPQSNSLAVVDIATPAAPNDRAFIHTGLAFRRGERWRQQPFGRGGHGRSRVRLQRAQRFRHRHRRQDQQVAGGDPHSHSRPGESARRAADGHGLPRSFRMAAGGRGRHQRGRR